MQEMPLCDFNPDFYKGFQTSPTILNLKMATAMFAETLEKLQQSTRP
jgi:hypothetical protein